MPRKKITNVEAPKTPEELLEDKIKEVEAEVAAKKEAERKAAQMLTPSEYFEKIKAMKEDIADKDFLPAIELAEAQLKKFTILKQRDAAENTANFIEMFKKEIKIVQAGFNQYILKKDLAHYMKDLRDKCVFVCELEDYPREIPDEIVNKIAEHMDLFDRIFIVFTDYTQKVSKDIDKKTRDKDPIMFGAINIRKIRGGDLVGPRFYFIGDWVDEYCELTMTTILDSYMQKENRDDVLQTASIITEKSEFVSAVTKFSNQAEEEDGTTLVNFPKDEATKL